MMQTLPQATGQVWDASCPASQATWLKQSKPLGTAIADRGIKVTVKPNPAYTWVAFDYKLTPGETTAFIEIASSNGQQVENLQLTGNRGQKVLDTRRLSPGVYVYTLVCKNLRKTGKLIVE